MVQFQSIIVVFLTFTIVDIHCQISHQDVLQFLLELGEHIENENVANFLERYRFIFTNNFRRSVLNDWNSLETRCGEIRLMRDVEDGTEPGNVERRKAACRFLCSGGRNDYTETYFDRVTMWLRLANENGKTDATSIIQFGLRCGSTFPDLLMNWNLVVHIYRRIYREMPQDSREYRSCAGVQVQNQ